MSGEYDMTFRSMGSDVRFLIGAPLLTSAPDPCTAGERELEFVEDFAARLSRFRNDSELSALNNDPRDRVPTSPLMRAAVSAAVWAARRSGGVVDPTLVGEIERAGYVSSLEGSTPASLADALAGAPPRRPARPNPLERWREISVDDAEGVVIRPAGLKLDTGGTGKGLCADAVAHRLAGYTRYVVDCGGDLAIGGVGAQLEPYEVEIEHPLTGETIRSVLIASGGVASSGLNVRLWQDADGNFAHHLLDPATGRPAWTGLIGVTALAPSALEAETLAKTALLLGPAEAPGVLEEHGGLLVHDSGDVQLVGPLDSRRGILSLAGGAA